MASPSSLPYFGSPIPFAEPYWYQGYPSPHYSEKHVALREKVRKFVEEEVKPYMEEWIEQGEYPPSLHEKLYQAGIGGIIYPKEYGGTRPDDWDAFMELVVVDEMARIGGGHILGQAAINSMALPPIINHGSQYLKDLVLKDVIQGRKFCCLAISEPTAGSDVAQIKTRAVRKGDKFIVNGQKKWITGGAMADFFTTAVRTGDEGMGGISILLIPRNLRGVSVRKMKTQFDSAHSTTRVLFEDVEVPVRNLIGPENGGFPIIVQNFNHERLIIAIDACRLSRIAYEESFTYAMQRETFGKKLIRHPVIREKLAEMARRIESVYDTCERISYAYSKGVPDYALGGQCALLKVQASTTFEFCAREAVQIFGGSGVVREGKGQVVERLYREVRGLAIPGGSEEILRDFAIRQAAGKAKRILDKQKAKL